MRMSHHASDEEKSSFTSIIDVVFLLLLFFLLQPFKSPELKLESPLSPVDGIPDINRPPYVPIELRIQGQGDRVTYAVNGTRLGADSRQLARAVRDAALGEDVPVVIDAEPGVHFAYVMAALDQCYLAEMKSVRFAAPPPGAP